MNRRIKYMGEIPATGAVNIGMQSNALIPPEHAPIWQQVAKRTAEDEEIIGLADVVIDDIPAAVERIKDAGLANTLLAFYNRACLEERLSEA